VPRIRIEARATCCEASRRSVSWHGNQASGKVKSGMGEHQADDSATSLQRQRPTGEMVVRNMQHATDDSAVREVRIRSDASIAEAFRERVAIMIYDGGLSEFDATRAAYFELRRAGGDVPHAVNEEWKRVGRLTK
jgi:hypothetical protein